MEPKYDPIASKATGGSYDVYTVNNNDLQNVINDQLTDFKNTQLGSYYYN